MTGGTGSYIFMAGEIFRHEPYNAKADIYSFGMIMYQMLTGSRPFSGMEPSKAAMRASVDGLRPEWPASPVHYSAEDCAALGHVQSLVERCWAHAPMSRCPSMPFNFFCWLVLKLWCFWSCFTVFYDFRGFWVHVLFIHACMHICRPSSAEVIHELDGILADLSSPRLRYKDILNAGSPKPKKGLGFGFFQNVRTSRTGSPRVGKEVRDFLGIQNRHLQCIE